MDSFLSLIAAFAAVATLMVPASAQSPPASLECVCKSTRFDDVHFYVKCQRNVQNSQTTGDDFLENSAVSCRREKPPPPAPDYKHMPGVGWFKVHTDIKRWEDALVACAREGASLTKVPSKEVENFLIELLKPYPNIAPRGWTNEMVWIGFSDLDKEGEYVAPDGTNLRSLNYVNWSAGEPNNSENNEDCVAFFRGGQLNDAACGAELGFICFRKG